MDAQKVFLEYANQYDRSNGKVELKIEHTLAVDGVMEYLAGALGLEPHLAYLAHLCAIFHDIGRFEQVKRYDTFLDFQSVDHAQLGCQVLRQEGFLAELPAKEQEMVLTAIRNHNRMAIEDGLDGDTLLLCRLIRDADKCDIFRVFACGNMKDTMGETEDEVAQECLSDLMLQSILERRCVKKEERRTGLDIWVSYLGFFFDMNFRESLQFLQKRKYYRQPFDRVTFANPETARRVALVLEEIERYLAERLAQ